MSELHEELQGYVGDVMGEAVAEVEDILNDARLMLPSLETFVRSMDKVMDSANAIKTAAEKSNYSTIAMANAIRAHERQMGLIYGLFTKARSNFEAMAKKVDVPLKGPKAASRKTPAKVDAAGMTTDQLEADITRLYNALGGIIRQSANDGAFFLAEMRKFAAKKSPAYDTVRGELASLVQDFLKFRGGVYKFFGVLEGIVKRLNLRAKQTGDIEMSRYKPPKKSTRKVSKKRITKEDVDIEGASPESLFEAVHNRPPSDPVELLEWAHSRDRKRGMGFFDKR